MNSFVKQSELREACWNGLEEDNGGSGEDSQLWDLVNSLYGRPRQTSLGELRTAERRVTLLAKGENEKLLRNKLSEVLRGRAVTFGELAEKADFGS